MSIVRSVFALVLSLGLVIGATPAGANSSGDIVDIQDIAGDANLVLRDTETSPASYPAADLLSVNFDTSYEAVPVGGNGLDYRPKELVAVFTTTASAAEIASGSQMLFRASADGDDLASRVFIEGVISKSSAGALSTTARLRYESPQCGNSPDRCWSASKPEWTAQVSAAQKTLTLRYPFSSLELRERRQIGVGAILGSPKASTLVPGIESAAQDGFLPAVDDTPFGHGFVVGADVPDDVDCTEACEDEFLPCFKQAGWSDGGGRVRFFAGGDEACRSMKDVGGVKLTVTGRRCPKGSTCTDTQVVEECAGRRCVADLYMSYERTETASYKVIAKWEFGDGKVFTFTVSGLCHRLSPLDDCPESDSAHKEFIHY